MSEDDRERMDPEAYYDEFGEGEWDRLAADPVGRLEYENTVAALDAHLPEEGVVLDAGGGPGRYAVLLGERGYRVEHLDLSAEQVRIARERVAEAGVEDCVSCRRGDVRDLPFAADRFDAVCCLGGPLSHVLDPDERERTVGELRRVALPGAPVFVSVIGRLNALQDGIRHGLDDHPGMLVEIAAHGDYTRELVEQFDAEGWAECHFFRVNELESLLRSAGLDVERILGLEGPASGMQPELADAPEDAVDAVATVVHRLRDDRGVADNSEHILAVARA
jgi:SAM-dependent methyltransferase